MKKEVLLILLALLAILSAYFVFAKPAYPMTVEDAKKFFLEDLKEKYPGADTREVMEISPQTYSDGTSYYQLKARVINGAGTPCPERIHVYYDYPPKNFVAQPPEYITKGCQVCINEPKCTLAFPEEAIIASHTYPGTEAVGNFIRQYADARASATAMDSYKNYAGVWVVEWTSQSSAVSYTVVLSKSDNVALEIIPAGQAS
jgi:hypothetical protein